MKATIAKYRMVGNQLHLDWDGAGYHFNYALVQNVAESMVAHDEPDAWVWQGALQFMREHLTVADVLEATP